MRFEKGDPALKVELANKGNSIEALAFQDLNAPAMAMKAAMTAKPTPSTRFDSFNPN